jgi:hypothetical protein
MYSTEDKNFMENFKGLDFLLFNSEIYSDRYNSFDD